MSTASTKKRPVAASPLEQPILKRYSPHHELPLSTLTSVVLHLLVLGLIAVIAIQWNRAQQSDVHKPPKIDVVEIEGGGGLDGAGEGSGPGAVNQGGRTEQVAQIPGKVPQGNDTKPQNTPTIKTPVGPSPLEAPVPGDEDDPAQAELFAAVLDQARAVTAQAMQVPASTLANTGTASGSAGRDRGTGGGAGGGVGKGIGSKKGPGAGNSPTGVVLNRRQRREMRWRIDFSGDGPTHLKKLQALNVILAIPTRQQGVFRIYELSKGLNPRLDNLVSNKDKVKWFNTSPGSLKQLASVLRLSETPPFVAIFLPEAIEEEMSRLEHEYRGLEEHQITLTEFQIRERPDGRFGPVVVAQR